MPDVALRVDGAVVEGEAVAAPRVRQEDVAVGGRGGPPVLLEAAVVAAAVRRKEASARGEAERMVGLVAYRQPQTAVRSPVAVDSLHRQILA